VNAVSVLRRAVASATLTVSSGNRKAHGMDRANPLFAFTLQRWAVSGDDAPPDDPF